MSSVVLIQGSTLEDMASSGLEHQTDKQLSSADGSRSTKPASPVERPDENAPRPHCRAPFPFRHHTPGDDPETATVFGGLAWETRAASYVMGWVRPRQCLFPFVSGGRCVTGRPPTLGSKPQRQSLLFNRLFVNFVGGAGEASREQLVSSRRRTFVRRFW
jgi:hypothetical protein